MLLVHFLVSATDPLLQYIIENSINIVSISRRSLPGGDTHVTVDDRRSQLCAEMYREIYEEFRRKMNYFVDECNSDPSDEIDYDNIIGDFE